MKIEQESTEIDTILSELPQHVDKSEFVVMHSALHVLGSDFPRHKWRILESISGMAATGLTVLIPSFSFSFTKERKFLFPNGNSETGLLADWVRELSTAKRTKHPIYSFVVIGRKATEVLQCSTTTCFGSGSVFELLNQQSSRILMFGAEWDVCTLFHYYEELLKVPYRYHKKFSGKLVRDGKEIAVSSTMYVRNLFVNSENDFSPIVSKLRNDKKIVTGRFGIIESAKVSDIADACSSLLKKNPYALVSNREVTRHQIEKQNLRMENSPLRVFIYGSQNNEIIKNSAVRVFADYFLDQHVQVECHGFGQHKNVFFGGRIEKYDCVICVERYSHLRRPGNLSDRVQKKDVRRYVSEIKEIASRLSKSVVVCTFSHTDASQWSSHVNSSEQDEANVSVDEANRLLSSELSEQESIVLIDIDAVSDMGTHRLDARLEFLARAPFSEQFSTSLALCVAGRLLARYGKSIRLLLVDLDNTLWGGVAGEDGTKGIQIGQDYPGNIFLELQRQLKRLTNRGIALGIVSKNDERTVQEIFDKHSSLLLTYQDFIVKRINWESKVDNIQSISQEVGLGLENIGFLDDNPVEREQVKTMLPEVKVLAWADDIADMPKMLDRTPYLASWKITGEDQEKLYQYHSRRKISEVRHRLSDRREFLKQLNISIFLQNIDESNVTRVVQLFAKTNQFTATGHRLTGEEIEGLGYDSFLVLGALDKFSERENIGVLRLKDDPGTELIEIQEFVLSCRALGKGIEEKVLSWVIDQAYRHKRKKLRVWSKKLARNAPIINLYHHYRLHDNLMQISYQSTTQFSMFNCVKVYDQREYGVFHG